jgi:hypothetical protein
MTLLLDDQDVRMAEYVRKQQDGFLAAYAELCARSRDDPCQALGPRPRAVTQAFSDHAATAVVRQWVRDGGPGLVRTPGGGVRIPSFMRVDVHYDLSSDGWCGCPDALTRAAMCKHMTAVALLRGGPVRDADPRLVFDELLVARLAPDPAVQLAEQRQRRGPETLAAAASLTVREQFPLWGAAHARVHPPAHARVHPPAAADVAATVRPPPASPLPGSELDHNHDDDGDAPPPPDPPSPPAAVLKGADLRRTLTAQISRVFGWLEDVAAVRPDHASLVLEAVQLVSGQLKDQYALRTIGTPGHKLGRAVTGATSDFVPVRRRGAPEPAAADPEAAIGQAPKRICRGGGCIGCDAPRMWSTDEPLVQCAACGRECHVQCVGAVSEEWRCGACFLAQDDPAGQ